MTAAAHPDEAEKARLDRELDLIRARREGDKRFFRGAFEDYTLLLGVIIGAVFFGGVFVMSSGWIAGDSVVIDSALSQTPLDPGGDCIDPEGQIWIKVYFDYDPHLIVAKSNNIGDDQATVMTMIIESESPHSSTEYIGGKGDLSRHFDPTDLADGEYNATFRVWKIDTAEDLSVKSTSKLQQFVNNSELVISVNEKTVKVEIESRSKGLFSSELKQEVTIHDDEPRECWTVEGLGDWGWKLMGAEWIGGRETAMLTGGSAGIPAWWLAVISLGMSLFFLCVQYPLMHKMYHRDVDDLLTEAQLRRLIRRTLRKAQSEVRIDIDFHLMKMQERAISIDVLLPYRTISTTIGDAVEIKAGLTRSLLEEFSIFGEMRPLQLKTLCVDDATYEAHEGARISLDVRSAAISPVEDYSSFFADMSAYGWLEAAAQTSLNRWFKKHDLAEYGTAVLADEDAVFVRVIYRPVTRFTYFLFKPSYRDMQDDLRDHLMRDLSPHLDGRDLIVSARNEKATLSDRAAAGRVEQGSDEFRGEAMVAKQGGITGALLQNPFMGDILSSVEYVAHKNRARIDKYGYWGLIVFVWIPFMASGVLVGAMLGLVARMRFQRVLAACLFGGTAASLTWAYTARGIIETMKQYHAEAFIPFVIALVVLFTIMHLRRNKRLRREELFRESMAFFAGAAPN